MHANYLEVMQRCNQSKSSNCKCNIGSGQVA
jgi:hypothetical protein